MPDEPEHNAEWELAELVDAISASVDQAEDTLSLKSYARGMAFAIKQLQLDLEVAVRLGSDGRVLFRTREPGGTAGGTVLKLDFAQMLQGQLAGVRRSLDHDGVQRQLETLDGITAEETRALAAVGIFSVDDLERYTQSAAMLAELSRKTGMGDARLRAWRGLPYFSAVNPPAGAPATTVTVEGGNFGDERDAGTLVVFQGQPVAVESWSARRIALRMPDGVGSGMLFAVIGGQATNPLEWQATAPQLTVDAVTVTPERSLAGEPVRLQAGLANTGSVATSMFGVRWIVDGQAGDQLPHGPLLPGQRSSDAASVLELRLAPGTHVVRFEVDPDHKLDLPERTLTTFQVELPVAAPETIEFAAHTGVSSLDPMASEDAGPMDVLRLVFRGLGRPGGKRGALVPDLAQGWDDLTDVRRGTEFRVTLREDARFHDGLLVTPDDVVFSYGRALAADSPWSGRLEGVISGAEVLDDRTVALRTDTSPSLRATDFPAAALMVPIVPRRAYAADPAGFGRAPIGAGPFAVTAFEPGGRIELRADPHYAPVARLDRVVITAPAPADEIADRLRRGELAAAQLPYSADAERDWAGTSGWTVSARPDGAPRDLDVQAGWLQERAAGRLDVAGNAELWYIRT